MINYHKQNSGSNTKTGFKKKPTKSKNLDDGSITQRGKGTSKLDEPEPVSEPMKTEGDFVPISSNSNYIIFDTI